MRPMHGCHDPRRIVRSASPTYMPLRHWLSALLPPCSPCSSLQAPRVCELRLRSPLERSRIFPGHDFVSRCLQPVDYSRPRDRRSAILTHPCTLRMAVMYPAALLKRRSGIILVPVDVTWPVSSSLGFMTATTGSKLLSSSLEPGPPANGVSSSLVHLPHFDYGLCPIIQAPSSDGAFFFAPVAAGRQIAENAWLAFRTSVCPGPPPGRYSSPTGCGLSSSLAAFCTVSAPAMTRRPRSSPRAGSSFFWHTPIGKPRPAKAAAG